MKKLLIFIFLFGHIYCEHMVSIKLMGISFHPKGANSSKIMPLKFDNEGFLVPNFGIIFSYENKINDTVSFRVSQGFYYDCALQPAGFSQINIRGDIYKNDEFRINGGCGPTLIYRKSWEGLEGYNPTSFYKSRGKIEYVYLWYGGDFEFDKRLDKDTELQIAFVPGYPALMNLSAGIIKH